MVGLLLLIVCMGALFAQSAAPEDGDGPPPQAAGADESGGSDQATPIPRIQEAPPAECGSLQTLVDAAAPGDTVDVPACVYRETVTVAKPLTLDGHGKVQIRGSDVWSSWVRRGNYWVAGPAPSLPVIDDHDRCAPKTEIRCLKPEQVFMDGQPLNRASGDPGPGQFGLDAKRNIVLADDPTGRTVEVSTRQRWISIESDGVTIQGFTMKHAANDAQSGGLSIDGHAGTTIQDNVLSDAHGDVVSITRSTHTALLRNDISRGGQLGVNVSNAAGLVVQGNTIHDNNTDGFRAAWEAGGLKATRTTDAVWDANQVYANAGPGLWCDIRCRHIVYSNNRVHHNAGAGIFFEISDGAKIESNTLWENNWTGARWGWGAAILISSSANAEVAKNLLAWNAGGISVISQDRVQEAGGTHVTGNDVHDNVIVRSRVAKGGDYGNLMLAWLQDWDGGMTRPEANNRGANNLFWYPAQDQRDVVFVWGGRDFTKLEAFGESPGGKNGSYLSSADRDWWLSAGNVPVEPEPH